MKWIETNKEKPFFAYISTNAPHSPFIVDEKYSDLYKDAKMPGAQLPVNEASKATAKGRKGKKYRSKKNKGVNAAFYG